jgi:hypothetical protein
MRAGGFLRFVLKKIRPCLTRLLPGFVGFLTKIPALRSPLHPGWTGYGCRFRCSRDLPASHARSCARKLPPFLKPRKGRLGLVDYEKIFCPDLKSGPDIFDARGLDRKQGCLVIVRPDQHVAHVLPLNAHDELAAFFNAIFSDLH